MWVSITKVHGSAFLASWTWPVFLRWWLALQDQLFPWPCKVSCLRRMDPRFLGLVSDLVRQPPIWISGTDDPPSSLTQMYCHCQSGDPPLAHVGLLPAWPLHCVTANVHQYVRQPSFLVGTTGAAHPSGLRGRCCIVQSDSKSMQSFSKEDRLAVGHVGKPADWWPCISRSSLGGRDGMMSAASLRNQQPSDRDSWLRSASHHQVVCDSCGICHLLCDPMGRKQSKDLQRWLPTWNSSDCWDPQEWGGDHCRGPGCPSVATGKCLQKFALWWCWRAIPRLMDIFPTNQLCFKMLNVETGSVIFHVGPNGCNHGNQGSRHSKVIYSTFTFTDFYCVASK